MISICRNYLFDKIFFEIKENSLFRSIQRKVVDVMPCLGNLRCCKKLSNWDIEELEEEIPRPLSKKEAKVQRIAFQRHYSDKDLDTLKNAILPEELEKYSSNLKLNLLAIAMQNNWEEEVCTLIRAIEKPPEKVFLYLAKKGNLENVEYLYENSQISDESYFQAFCYAAQGDTDDDLLIFDYLLQNFEEDKFSDIQIEYLRGLEVRKFVQRKLDRILPEIPELEDEVQPKTIFRQKIKHFDSISQIEKSELTEEQLEALLSKALRNRWNQFAIALLKRSNDLGIEIDVSYFSGTLSSIATCGDNESLQVFLDDPALTSKVDEHAFRAAIENARHANHTEIENQLTNLPRSRNSPEPSSLGSVLRSLSLFRQGHQRSESD